MAKTSHLLSKAFLLINQIIWKKQLYTINTIPDLVTVAQQIEEAKRWIEGSFHELKDVFRIITWEEMKEYYDVKRKIKELEAKLKLI